MLDDRVKFVPERYAKTYQAWLENLRDWPISRQLWWGHQIPIWRVTLKNPIPEEHELTSVGEVFDICHKYFDESKEMFRHIAAKHGVADRLAVDDWPFHPDVLAFHICPADESASDTLDAVLSDLSERVAAVERDPDVLDTWFSSALWPFSTLGWPDETPEVETFYPGQLLCTAREIITLWVSRMVMMGQYCVGDIPFTDVFIHAMIQDGEGRKMSKSLGNGIDPLDIIDSHGSDAMRFTLASMTTQTQDVRMPVERFTLPDGRKVNTSLKFDVGRNFCNKLWNAARFAMLNLSDGAPCVDLADLEFTDRWILSRCNAVVGEVTDALLAYRFSDAANAAYDFAWHDFCDWYVEIVKPRLSDGGGGQARAVVAHVLDSILRLLHPFMPFITEELWQSLGSVVAVRGIGEGAEAAASIMVAPWPKPMAELEAPGLDAQMGTVQEIIRAVRNIRSKAGVAGKQQIEILVSSADAEAREALTANEAFVLHIANATKLTVGEGIAKPAQAATEVTGFAEVFVPLEGLIDSDAERARLEKKLGELRGKLGGVEKKLSNESFTAKAPAEIVERERAKAADIRSQVEAVERNLEEL